MEYSTGKRLCKGRCSTKDPGGKLEKKTSDLGSVLSPRLPACQALGTVKAPPPGRQHQVFTVGLGLTLRNSPISISLFCWP